jgi:hypothetical protein
MVRGLAVWPVSGGVALCSWQAGCVVAALSLGVELARLAAGWRRERLVLALMDRAPAGTVVTMGPAELPSLRVRVGSKEGPRDACRD